MLRLVAFDLDGVLYSSEAFLGDAYREAIAAVNRQRPASFPRVPSTREVLDHVGWPASVILQRLFPDVESAAVELLHDRLQYVIAEHVRRQEGELFPGVGETLAELSRTGLTLAVASNGRQLYVDTVLSTYDLARFFAPLVTVDAGAATDKGGLLRAYLMRHATNAAEMVMVGDRASDVEAARSVGCAFVGCDYGHGYRAEIENAGPIVSTFGELPAVLAMYE